MLKVETFRGYTHVAFGDLAKGQYLPFYPGCAHVGAGFYRGRDPHQQIVCCQCAGRPLCEICRSVPT